MSSAAKTSGKQLAREIFRDTLAALDIPRVMELKLELSGSTLILDNFTVNLSGCSSLLVIAVGKAAHAMAAGLRAFLPDSYAFRGVVAAPTKPEAPIPGLAYFVAGHPNPNEDSWRAAEAILALLPEANERSVVFFLLSGGGSALLELPLVPGMRLEDLQAANHALVTCGAPIEAMNTVRRHLSAVKGGRLALAAARATKVTLAVTDVPEGKENALASGPTVPDPSGIADANRIIEQYGLRKRFPEVLVRWLDAGKMPETPKPGDPAFRNAHFQLLLGMHDLFHAAHHAAEARGYLTCCDNSTDDWPVTQAADELLKKLEEWRRENPGQRVALVADGELSSPVTGNGIGGRNSAFVLSCVEKIAGRQITVLSAGTDGMDGNSPAAGAVADGESLARAKTLGLDPATAFEQSDACTFFAKLDDAILTGPTGNNLRDLRIFLVEP
jgi:hydroxypyruvate reductase